MRQQHRKVTVIGAGIVGIAIAVCLQREGHAVTVLDRTGPGEGCSRGNAGILALDSVAPLASPRRVLELPRILTDPDAPVRVDWRAIAGQLPWFVRFVLASRRRRVRASARALAALLRTALDDYRPLLEAAGARDLVRESGWLSVYEAQRAFAHADTERVLQRRFGIRMEVLSGSEARALVPALGPRVQRAVHFPGVAHTVEPYRLVQALAQHFHDRGGRIVQEAVTGVERPGSGGLRLRTHAGVRDPGALVVAAGAESREIAAWLGQRVPLAVERGYHLMLPQPGIELAMPVVAAEHAFAATPMLGGLRLAGTSEIVRAAAPPDFRRAHILLERGRRLFPDLQGHEYTQWMGRRSTVPDSLPVIGPVGGLPDVYFAFGHQHLGLTLAAVTGRLVADLVAGRPTDIDMRPYRVDRF
jgi:glycine/D-amino acid oxidase-like deaminating enzyme